MKESISKEDSYTIGQKIEVISDLSKLLIKIKGERRIFNFFGWLVPITALLMILGAKYFTAIDELEMLLGFCILILMLLLMAYSGFRQFFVKERLLISGEDLLLERDFVVYQQANKYKLSEVNNFRNISVTQSNMSPLVLTLEMICGLKRTLAFDYKDLPVVFGGNLNDDESQKLLSIIKTRIGQRNL